MSRSQDPDDKKTFNQTTTKLVDSSRRDFLQSMAQVGIAASISLPVKAFAKPQYNVGFWRQQGTEIFVTQAFASVAVNTIGVNGQNSELNTTQSFASVAVNTVGVSGQFSELNTTQSYVLAAVSVVGSNGSNSELRTTQVFAQVLAI